MKRLKMFKISTLSLFHETILNRTSMKNYVKLLTLFGLLAATPSVSAQVEKSFFQTFTLPDSVKQIKFDLPDNYQVETWNGVQMMVETAVRLENAGIDLLDMLVADGRYRIYLDTHTDTLALKLPQRLNLKSKTGGIINETARLKIYLPENFYLKPEQDQTLAKRD